MNPSTQEILPAFENLPTDNILVLPNNKNIILAAQAVTELTAKNVAVIPSRTIPQGLAAMMRLAPEGDFDEVVEDMTSVLDGCRNRRDHLSHPKCRNRWGGCGTGAESSGCTTESLCSPPLI